MRLLNLGILAHVDAGKTTVVEQMLYLCGQIGAPGSVDKGDTHTDWLPVERRRGISVAAASVSLAYQDIQINLIDTPGHMDFIGEVERALAALDAVVLVVSAAEGIQSQTEIFWKATRALHLPTLVFVNKIDRTGCQPDEVLKALKQEFSSAILPLNGVQRPGSAACALAQRPLGEEEILELCALDDALAARYLDAGALPEAALREALAAQCGQGLAFPLLFGSAALGVGVDALLSAVAAFLPAAQPVPQGEVSGVVYKIEHSQTMGKAAHVRLFSGTLKNRDSVKLHRGGTVEIEEKITQIRHVSGEKRADKGVLAGGDIAAVYGLAGAKTGDILGHVRKAADAMKLAVPLFSVQVLAPPGQEASLLKAVTELADEDPLLACDWNPDERELVINIMGKIQLEILEFLLLERYNLQVTFSPPTVIYQETPLRPGTGLERYTMPKPCWAVVELGVQPLPRGAGFQYRSLIKADALPYRYQNHIETSVPETLRQGLLGWQVTDLEVTLTAGQHHHVHTHPLDFFLATPIAVMKALTNCGTALLEPLVKLRLTAEEGLSGRVIRDILDMRGSFDSPVMAKGRVEIEALVPVATSQDYSTQFASLTSGKGVLRSEFYGYANCPPGFRAETKRRGVNPLDRAKWILYRRSALSG